MKAQERFMNDSEDVALHDIRTIEQEGISV